MRRSFGSTGENFSRFALMSRSAQRRRIALSSPRLAKPYFGSFILSSPSAPRYCEEDALRKFEYDLPAWRRIARKRFALSYRDMPKTGRHGLVKFSAIGLRQCPSAQRY